MCYSAQIRSAYDKFVRQFGATLDVRQFAELYGWRLTSERPVRIPKAVDALFAGASQAEREIRALIARYAAEQGAAWEQALFEQRTRLADAERKLASAKPTKAAAESARIAADKVQQLLGRLADLRSSTPKDDDSRFFPGWWVPVMIEEDGQRVVKPMRYQCRPAGKPALHDTRFPGTYNARRDSLGGYWKGLFGRTHGLVCVNAFFENVRREGKNAVLEFRPRPPQDMLMACLWSRWEGENGEALLSFAAITDDPPAEVAAAGHDRCIVPIKAEHVDAWLKPDPRNLAAQYAILDDRERPYYEHRLAA